jgi:hypothetical protein
MKPKRFFMDESIDSHTVEDVFPDIEPDYGQDIMENDLSDFDKENLYPRRPSGT